jgi:hypothetical protein
MPPTPIPIVNWQGAFERDVAIRNSRERVNNSGPAILRNVDNAGNADPSKPTPLGRATIDYSAIAMRD